MQSEGAPIPINTVNEFMVSTGQNLPNHSSSLAGLPKFVSIIGGGKPMQFRTKQTIYRLAAWLLCLAEVKDLPDEPGAHTFEQVLEAIRNT